MADLTLGIDLSEVFAPIYWGFFVSTLLGGISILQAYIYFMRTSDRGWIQWIAVIMITFDIASSALVGQSIYYYLIPHFGSLSPLASVTPGLSAECLLSTIITFISQMYFVYQIHAVTQGHRSRLIPMSIGVFAFCAFAGGVACTSVMILYKHAVLANRNMTFAVFFGIAKGFGAWTDILATIAMCHFLSSSKRFTQTSSVIEGLMKIIIHRGVLVTLIQTLLLIVFYAAPNRLYWLPFHINVTKLYVNVFFAMLNARAALIQNETLVDRSGLSKIPASQMASSAYTNSYPMAGMGTTAESVGGEEEDSVAEKVASESLNGDHEGQERLGRSKSPAGPQAITITRTVVVSSDL